MNTSNRRDVLAYYQTVYMASEGYAARMGWTGNVAAGIAGTTSTLFQADVLRRINFYRALVGLPADITFNSTKSSKDQDNALWISANGYLTHYPSGGTFYKASVAEAASHSNLAWGCYGPGAIDGYMDDEGNSSMGHRRWLLYSLASEMGTGDVPENSEGRSANATWVLGDSKASAAKVFVPWPNAGFTPINFAHATWSVSYPGADFSGAQITMTRRDSGTSQQYWGWASDGYGDNSLMWNPSDVPTAISGDTTFDIVISGIRGSGVPSKYTYSVTLFDPSVLGDSVEISGDSNPPSTGANYSFSAVEQADKYELSVSTASLSSWTEGAESSPTPKVQATTTGSYSVIQSTTKRTGSNAFHLAFPDGTDQYLVISRDFIPSATSTLNFYDLGRFSTTSTTLNAEVSSDNGLSWRSIWSRPGVGLSSSLFDAQFNTRSVSLAAYAGQTIRARFALKANGSSYCTSVDNNGGFFIDDISVTNSVELINPTSTVLPSTATTFFLNSAVVGGSLAVGQQYYMQIRPMVGTQWFGYGALKKIIPSQATPPSITAQPTALNVVAGSGANFSVLAVGSSPLSYQWMKDGANLAGGTSATYSIGTTQTADSGSYRVVVSNPLGSVSSGSASLSVSKANQAIGTFSAIANKTFGDAAFAVTPPTATSGLPVSLAVKSGPATMSGNNVTLIGAGSVVLSANQAGNANYNAANEVTTNFSVSKRSQTIASLGVIPNKTFGDPPFTVNTPAASSGLGVVLSVKSGPAIVSGNTVTFTGVGTAVLAANQAGDNNYSAAPEVTVSITQIKGAQTISTFSPVNSHIYGDAPFPVATPVSSAGLPVSVTVKSGPATISNGTVTVTGAGTVVLAANQSGSTEYNPATEVTTTFVVARATQSIGAFETVANKTFGDASFAVSAPASTSGLPVSLGVKSGPATISGNTVTLTGAGTVTLSAVQAGNSNYGAAAEVTTSFSVGKQSQNLSGFGVILSKSYGDAPFTVNAPSASSGLPVSLSVKSGPGSLSGGKLSLTGAGTIVLAANQSGDANYSLAAEVTTSFVVAQGTQNIGVFAAIPDKTFGDAVFSVVAPVASSGLPVSLAVKSGPATMSGNTVTLTGAGTVVISASQTGSANYKAANEVTTSFSVAKRNQTLAGLSTIASKTYGDAPFSVSAPSATSGLVAELSVKSGPATISNGTVSITGTGTVVLAANQSGDANYNAAPEVWTSFASNKATPAILELPTTSEITFGQTLGASTLGGGAASVAGSFAFKSPNATPNRGTSLHSVIFSPEDQSRYSEVVGLVSVKVNALVIPPVINGGTVLTGALGSHFTHQISANNFPTAFKATGLPTGLNLNAATGLISGSVNVVGQFTITVTASNSAGAASAVLLLNVTPNTTISWPDLVGTYEGILEQRPDLSVDDLAAYRGAFVLTFSRSGTVSGRVLYNEATALAGNQARVYLPVTRSFTSNLDATPNDPLTFQKSIKLGPGTSAVRQELNLEVSFATTPPTINVILKDYASPSPGAGAWVSESLNLTRSVAKLPVDASASSDGLDYTKAAGRYTMYASDGSPTADTDAYVLAQLLPTGKLIWTSRMKGALGSGSTGMKMTAGGLKASFYESRVSSSSNLLETMSLLGSLNFAPERTAGDWKSYFGSDALPGKIEKQASYVSKVNGKLSFDVTGSKNWTGVANLDFSDQEGMRWGNASGTTLPAFLGAGSAASPVFMLSAQDPLLDPNGKAVNQVWNVSIAVNGKITVTSALNSSGILSPRLTLALDKQRGELIGHYTAIVSGKSVKRDLYGCALISQQDKTLRTRGWVESGALPAISTGGWKLQLGQ